MKIKVPRPVPPGRQTGNIPFVQHFGLIQKKV